LNPFGITRNYPAQAGFFILKEPQKLASKRILKNKKDRLRRIVSRPKPPHWITIRQPVESNPIRILPVAPFNGL